MMFAQESESSSLAGFGQGHEALRLASGKVVGLGKGGGDLVVLSGRVWLTSSGDPSDHVLGAGEALRVGAGGALVESWPRHAPALVEWHPRSLLQRVRDLFHLPALIA